MCELWKGNTYTVSWVPEKYAKKDKVVGSWVVKQVWMNTKTTRVPSHHIDIKGHRIATGDAIPKKGD